METLTDGAKSFVQDGCRPDLMLGDADALWTDVDSDCQIPRQSSAVQKSSTDLCNGRELPPCVLDTVTELLIAYHGPLHLVEAVNHSRVVSAPEGLPDLH